MNNIIKRKWNKNSMVIIEDLQGMAFQAESGGHTFQISGIDGEGNTVALSGTPAGVMLRSDGQDVALTCSVSGGVVSATLPANAYSVPGRFGLTIFLTSDGQKTAIYAAVGTVGKTSSGTVAPPAGSDVVDLVNAIATAVATIPASYTDLMAAVAPTYSTSGLYAVGSYAWYNGKLYRCTTAITSGETWTSGHWTLANLGSDLVDLKSAVSQLEQLQGDNLIALTDFTDANSGITYSVDSGTNEITITNSSTGNYACLQTPATFVETNLVQGKTYRLHVKGETLSGSPVLMVAVRGTNGNVNGDAAIFTVPDGSDSFIDFVADQYMKKIAFYMSHGSSTKNSSAKFGEVWLKESAQSEIRDLENEINELETIVNDSSSHVLDRELYLNGMLERDIIDEYTVMKRGQYAMSSNQCVENSSTSRIIIQAHVPVVPGDECGLWDYTNAVYRYSVKRDSDGKFDYSADPINTDTIIENSGVLYIEIRKPDGAISDSEIQEYAKLVKIRKNRNNILADTKYDLMSCRQYDNIVANGKFLSSDFVRGERTTTDGYVRKPNTRTYRATNVFPFRLIEDYTISAENGYRFYSVVSSDNGATWSNVSWKTSYTFTKGMLLGIILAKTDETDTSQANVNLMVSKFNVTTPFKETINNLVPKELPSNVLSAVEDHMSHFYASNVADGFVFFTDPHLMGKDGVFDENVFNTYIERLKDVTDRITAEIVLCGGDWLHSGDTKAQAAMKLGFVDGQMTKAFRDRYCPVVGNHDYNYLGVDGEGERLTESNWVSKTAMTNLWFYRFGKNYYSVDLNHSKMYVLDTRTDYDSFNDYDKAMLDWFAAQLIADNPAHSFVSFHIYVLSPSNPVVPKRVKCIGKIIQAFNAHTTCILTSATDGYEKTYDFTGKTGSVDFVIVGHNHADSEEAFGGVPLIVTTQMKDNSVPTFDLVFSDYSASKLYLTRIGSGANRYVHLSPVNVSGSEILTASEITPVSWESTDDDVATVSSGTVTAVAAGSCCVEAIGNNGEKEAWIVIIA